MTKSMASTAIMHLLKDALTSVGETSPARVLREAGEYARAKGLSQGDAYEIIRRVYAGRKQDAERSLATTLLVAAKEAVPMLEEGGARLVNMVNTPRLTERLCECPSSTLIISTEGRCKVCGLRKYDPDR